MLSKRMTIRSLFFKLENNSIVFIIELEEKDEANLKTPEDTASIGSNSVSYIYIYLFFFLIII